MLESAVILSALGIVSLIAGALVWLLKKLFTQNDETIKQNTAATQALIASIEKQTKLFDKQEIASKEWQSYVIGRFDNIEHIGNKILSQSVTEQTVAHQTVLHTDKQ